MKYREALMKKQAQNFYKILMGLSIQQLEEFKEVIEKIIEKKTNQE